MAPACTGLRAACLALLVASLAAPGGAGAADAAPPVPPAVEQATAAPGDGASPPPYVGMPARPDGPLPRRLSQTGAFLSTSPLHPAPGLIAFAVAVPLWSDGAQKTRWISLPRRSPVDGERTGIGFAVQDPWRFPDGTVFVKEFALRTDRPAPGALRRLETRLLVRSAGGGVYGVTYRWRDDQSDADLVDAAGREEAIGIGPAAAGFTQTWHYPSRAECLVCHNAATGGVLGVKTSQLNRPWPEGPGGMNQLIAWNRRGLFLPPIDEHAVATDPALVADAAAPVAARARSYLDANCSHCHRPGVVDFATFDARFTTPEADQGIVDGPVIIDEGIDRMRLIAPQDPWRSLMLIRMQATDGLRMPPIAHLRLDAAGVALIRAWIASLPGPSVLAPPTLSLPGGSYATPLAVAITSPDPAATLYYTLDGSRPDSSALRYSGPVRIDHATTLRVRAQRHGWRSSITVNATYLIGADGGAVVPPPTASIAAPPRR